MEKIHTREVVPAAVLSILLPGLGLLYTHRCGFSTALVVIFFITIMLLGCTPLLFYSASFFFCVGLIFFVWALGIAVSIYSAKKGIFESDLIKDQGRWLLGYAFVIFLSFLFAQNFPTYIYRMDEKFENYMEGDYFIIQPVPENHTSSDFQPGEYILVHDNNNQERMAKVIALPGDLLDEEDGKTLRNGKPLPYSVKLPSSPWIVPDNLIFIDSPMALELSNLAVLRTAPESGAALVPFDRVRARIIFCLFSKTFSKIGEDLTPT